MIINKQQSTDIDGHGERDSGKEANMHGSNTITEVVVSNMVPTVSLSVGFVEVVSGRLEIWVESAA